ncbi:polysaccharide pyruvyl transferase family protein [Thiolapillus sp.]
MRILLTGYYGKANFGDDVLLKVAHGISRKWWPDADISVLCDGYRDDYLGKLLKEDVTILAPGEKGEFDLVVHGGGGTFFDFGSYGRFDRFLHYLMDAVGPEYYVRMHMIMRRLLGKQHLRTRQRVGWGIGVGHYARGSVKLRRDLPILMDFDSLMVRNSGSVERLREIGVRQSVTEGADLCFLDEYWVPDGIDRETDATSETKKLGVVLRDWPFSDGRNCLARMMKLLPVLRERYDLTLFVFDERTDGKLIEMAAAYKPVVWNPMKMSMEDYCRQLGAQDVVVSSRAHGVMCSVLLGVPAVALGIEPKLEGVHGRLPRSTGFLPCESLDRQEMIAAIEALLACPAEMLQLDVAFNRHLLETGMVWETGVPSAA